MPTILIVDDESDFRIMLSREAKAQGFEVLTAENGAIAVEIVKSKTVHAILLDLMMPEMDGQEALYWIKKAQPEVPIIITTNMSHGQIPEGANEVIPKVKTTPKELIEKISFYIS